MGVHPVRPVVCAGGKCQEGDGQHSPSSSSSNSFSDTMGVTFALQGEHGASCGSKCPARARRCMGRALGCAGQATGCCPSAAVGSENSRSGPRDASEQVTAPRRRTDPSTHQPQRFCRNLHANPKWITIDWIMFRHFSIYNKPCWQ